MINPDFKLKNKNILITGGAGFIGSNLCEYLLSCGANISCLDNFSTVLDITLKISLKTIILL